MYLLKNYSKLSFFRYSFRYNLSIKPGGAKCYQKEKMPKFKENKKPNGAKKSKSFSHVAQGKSIRTVAGNSDKIRLCKDL